MRNGGEIQGAKIGPKEAVTREGGGYKNGMPRSHFGLLSSEYQLCRCLGTKRLALVIATWLNSKSVYA